MKKTGLLIGCVFAMTILVGCNKTPVEENSTIPTTEVVSEAASDVEITTDVKINEENFPDEKLRDYLIKYCDKDANNLLSEGEAMLVTKVNTIPDLTSTKGFEYFPKLQEIVCEGASFDKLDVSANPELKKVICYDNPTLTEITGLSNTKLVEFECKNTGVTELDFGNLSHLESCWCEGNPNLKSVNVSGCSSLNYLICVDGSIEDLNLSGCEILESLYCYNNKIAELNIKDCPYLGCLECNKNQLSTLDLSGCPMLYSLNCEDNLLKDLDLSNQTDLSGIYVANNRLSAIDLSRFNGISGASVYGNPDCEVIFSKDCEGMKLAYKNGKKEPTDYGYCMQWWDENYKDADGNVIGDIKGGASTASYYLMMDDNVKIIFQ